MKDAPRGCGCARDKADSVAPGATNKGILRWKGVGSDGRRDIGGGRIDALEGEGRAEPFLGPAFAARRVVGHCWPKAARTGVRDIVRVTRSP